VGCAETQAADRSGCPVHTAVQMAAQRSDTPPPNQHNTLLRNAAWCKERGFQGAETPHQPRRMLLHHIPPHETERCGDLHRPRWTHAARACVQIHRLVMQTNHGLERVDADLSESRLVGSCPSQTVRPEQETRRFYRSTPSTVLAGADMI
jgi:hypothetical protein